MCPIQLLHPPCRSTYLWQLSRTWETMYYPWLPVTLWFSAQLPGVPVQRHPLVWRIELQLRLQEAAVDLVFHDP